MNENFYLHQVDVFNKKTKKTKNNMTKKLKIDMQLFIFHVKDQNNIYRQYEENKGRDVSRSSFRMSGCSYKLPATFSSRSRNPRIQSLRRTRNRLLTGKLKDLHCHPAIKTLISKYSLVKCWRDGGDVFCSLF